MNKRFRGWEVKKYDGSGKGGRVEKGERVTEEWGRPQRSSVERCDYNGLREGEKE